MIDLVIASLFIIFMIVCIIVVFSQKIIELYRAYKMIRGIKKMLKGGKEK